MNSPSGKKIPSKINLNKKKINPEILSQKYQLGWWSGRPLMKKSSYHCDFEKCRANPQLIDITPRRIFSALVTVVIYIHLYPKYIPYYYQEIWTKKWHTILKLKIKIEPKTKSPSILRGKSFKKWSSEPFFKKSSYQCDFENSWTFS